MVFFPDIFGEVVSWHMLKKFEKFIFENDLICCLSGRTSSFFPTVTCNYSQSQKKC